MATQKVTWHQATDSATSFLRFDLCHCQVFRCGPMKATKIDKVIMLLLLSIEKSVMWNECEVKIHR
jgi:hypothetical protein